LQASSAAGADSNGAATSNGSGASTAVSVGKYVVDIPRDMDLEKIIFGEQKTGINFDKYNSIAVEVNGMEVPKPIDAFADLLLPPVIKLVRPPS
jgi:hypothetical protein